MAKKNNKELVQVALDKHKWVNTPVVYTTFGSNFTNLQQDIMMQINGNLQGYIQKYLDEERYKDPKRPKPIFTPEEMVEGLEPIRISFANLGVGDGHYADTEKALEAIKELWVKAPVFDEETGLKKGEDYFPVFRKVFVPMSYSSAEGEDYKYADKTGEKQLARRDGYIDVTINEDVAKYVFDMSQGYFNHLERIAFFCNSAFTSRLYLLLMKYVSKGQMNPLIPYMELKDFLGMIEREKKSDKVKKEKYEKFSQFKKQVLDVAKKDMERLSDANNTEIVFDYEPMYKGTVRRGNPDAVKFHIKRTPLGIAREAELHRPSSEAKLIKTITDKYPTVGESRLKELVSNVPDTMWADFKAYAYKEMPKAVERPHRWDGTVDEFVMYLLKNFLDTYRVKVVDKDQLDLFGSEGIEEVREEGCATCRTEQSGGEVRDEDKEKWSRVVEKMNGSPAVEGMKLGSDDDGVYVVIPSRTFAETFKNEISIIKSNGYRLKVM